MSANVESMFSVRETPWHGLGTIIEEAPNSQEALIVAGLNWNVVPQPISVGGKLVDGYVANVRDSDNSVLGIVTNQYKVIQNSEAFAFTDALIDSGEVTYETAGSLANGKKVWMLARMPQSQILGEDVVLYMLFSNNHDGKGSIKVSLTPIRVVCQNTLNLALANAQRTWSTVHMGSIDKKLEEAKRTLELATSYMTELQNTSVVLANKTFNQKMVSDFITELIKIPNDVNPRRKENIIDMQKELAARLYKAPDLAEHRDNGWGVINAVSDLVTHSEPKRKSDTYKERLFDQVSVGHHLIDKAYKLILTA